MEKPSIPASLFGEQTSQVMPLGAKIVWKCGHGGILENGMTTGALSAVITFVKKLQVLD